MWRIILVLVLMVATASAFNYHGAWLDILSSYAWVINPTPVPLEIFGVGAGVGLGDDCFVVQAGYENLTMNGNLKSPPLKPKWGQPLVWGNTDWLDVKLKFCVPSDSLNSYPFFVAISRMQLSDQRTYGGLGVGLGVGIPLSNNIALEPMVKFDSYNDVSSIGIQAGFVVRLGGARKAQATKELKDTHGKPITTKPGCCPYCGANIQKDYNYCPACGHIVKNQ